MARGVQHAVLLRASLAAVCGLVAACHGPGPAPLPAARGLAQWEVVRRPPPAAAAVIRARWEEHHARREGGPAVVFLNFDGATIEAGADSNAATNTSYLAPGRVHYPAFDAAPFGLARAEAIGLIVAYHEFLFGGFDVVFVTERPATGDYAMVMIGGHGDVMGLAAEALGLAPLDCESDSGSLVLDLNPSDIVFLFSDSLAAFGLGLWHLAFATAHELAHAYGLAHVERELDIMNAYLTSDISRSWGTGSVTEADACHYLQDDVAFLAQALGRSTGADPAAQAYIRAPASGDVVESTLRVEVVVSAPAADTRVNLLIDGALSGPLDAEPFSFPVVDLLPGVHSLKARVQSGDRVGASNVVNVFVPVPIVTCSDDADCSDGWRCRAGACVGPPPAPDFGELGATCQYADECLSGRCLPGPASYCSRACRDDVGAFCPVGYECGSDGYCATKGDPGTGGCSAGSARPGAPAALCLAILLLIARCCRGALRARRFYTR